MFSSFCGKIGTEVFGSPKVTSPEKQGNGTPMRLPGQELQHGGARRKKSEENKDAGREAGATKEGTAGENQKINVKAVDKTRTASISISA
jgi:hypothetical protein